MNQQYLQEIEYLLLEACLKFLRSNDICRDERHLSDAFLELMQDPWTFCSALTDLYSVREMSDPDRQLAMSRGLQEMDDDEPMDVMFEDDLFAHADLDD